MTMTNSFVCALTQNWSFGALLNHSVLVSRCNHGEVARHEQERFNAGLGLAMLGSTRKWHGNLCDFLPVGIPNNNAVSVAVSFFICFAVMAPAITFGAVCAKSTNNHIGPVEMITAAAWCGILCALIGRLPLNSNEMANGGTLSGFNQR